MVKRLLLKKYLLSTLGLHREVGSVVLHLDREVDNGLPEEGHPPLDLIVVFLHDVQEVHPQEDDPDRHETFREDVEVLFLVVPVRNLQFVGSHHPQLQVEEEGTVEALRNQINNNLRLYIAITRTVNKIH